MFRYSICLATAVWLLARLVGWTDAWLHAATFTMTSKITPLPDSPPESTQMWGVSLNNSICDDMNTKYKDDIAGNTLDLGCLVPYEYFVFYEDWGHVMGFDAMTNSTDAAFHVGKLAGDMAFVLPGPKVVDTVSKNFLIPTFATQASCTSLNRACEKVGNGTSLNCTSAGYPNFPYYGTDVNRIPNRVLGVVEGDLIGRE